MYSFYHVSDNVSKRSLLWAFHLGLGLKILNRLGLGTKSLAPMSGSAGQWITRFGPSSTFYFTGQDWPNLGTDKLINVISLQFLILLWSYIQEVRNLDSKTLVLYSKSQSQLECLSRIYVMHFKSMQLVFLIRKNVFSQD